MFALVPRAARDRDRGRMQIALHDTIHLNLDAPRGADLAAHFTGDDHVPGVDRAFDKRAFRDHEGAIELHRAVDAAVNNAIVAVGNAAVDPRIAANRTPAPSGAIENPAPAKKAENICERAMHLSQTNERSEQGVFHCGRMLRETNDRGE